jgi:hypothetical protein
MTRQDFHTIAKKERTRQRKKNRHEKGNASELVSMKINICGIFFSSINGGVHSLCINRSSGGSSISEPDNPIVHFRGYSMLHERKIKVFPIHTVLNPCIVTFKQGTISWAVESLLGASLPIGSIGIGAHLVKTMNVYFISCFPLKVSDERETTNCH